MHSNFIRLRRTAVLLSLTACIGVHAQSANQSNELTEIVVTANKRSEPIDKVGMTISAFDGAALKSQGISDVADLAQIVPGLTYARSNTGTPVYTLRGVGFYETSLAAYPAVSVYVDQVSLPFPLLTSHTTLDIERVEVLKGPQGTLFGQNSTGGAINFIAAKPTDALAAGWDLTYGRFNRTTIEGFVSGPVTSNLNARLALSEETGSDWQRSYTRNDTLGAMHVFNGRLIADWKPLDTLRFEFNVNGWVDKSEPQAAQFYALDVQVPAAALPALLNYPVAPHDPRSADWGPERPAGDQTLFQTSVRTEYDVTPDATLTSLTAYVHGTRHDVLEPDGMAIDAYGYRPVGSINAVSEELRLANSSSDRLRYTVGGMFEHQQVLDNGILTYPDSSLAVAYGFADNGLESNQIMTNAAGFGNLDFDLTETNTLKAGARFTQSNRRDLGCAYDPGDGNIAAFFTFLSSEVRGTPTPPIQPGQCSNLNTEFLPTAFSAKLDQNNVSWRIGDDYKPTDSLLIYANVAKGYKAGSFPNVAASSTVQLEPVTQESVLDYELGFKKQLFQRRVAINGAVFYYDYKNKQLRSKYVDPVFGVLDKLANIPKSSIKGAELSIDANVIAGLHVNASVTYLDTTVKEFTGVNGAGVQANYAGTSIPFAPKFSSAAGLEYDWSLTGTLTSFAGANVTTNSKTYSVVGNDPEALLESFVLVDARAGIKTDDDRWRVQLWGKNITNRYYWTNAIVVYDQQVRYAGQPATFGITASYRYR